MAGEMERHLRGLRFTAWLSGGSASDGAAV